MPSLPFVINGLWQEHVEVEVPDEPTSRVTVAFNQDSEWLKALKGHLCQDRTTL